jgi:hypothetical protein
MMNRRNFSENSGSSWASTARLLSRAIWRSSRPGSLAGRAFAAFGQHVDQRGIDIVDAGTEIVEDWVRHIRPASMQFCAMPLPGLHLPSPQHPANGKE